MNKNLTEIVFILDRSGSMAGLESDTIGGFNAMIKEQKSNEGYANVSTILFDDKTEVLHDRVDIKEIKPMTDREYFVRGCTALLDAVGGAITHMGNVQKFAKEEDKAGKVLFIITTDGYENASSEFSAEKVKDLIERQKSKYGWEFIFMGANIDAVKTAKSFGISEDCAANYIADERGTELNFMAMNNAISNVRSNKKLSKDWKKDIEADFQNRKNK